MYSKIDHIIILIIIIIIMIIINIADREQSPHTPGHSYQRLGELILYMQISLTIAWERWPIEKKKKSQHLGFHLHNIL